MKSFLVATRNSLFARFFGAQRLVKYLASHKIFPQKVWAKLQPVGTFELKLPDGKSFKYCATANDQLARSVVWTNFADWENLSVELFYQLARTAYYVMDIGAYTGIYSLIACTANCNAKVEIFEPNPEMQGNIAANIKANSFEQRIVVHELALSSESGVLEFILTADRTASRLSMAYDGERAADKVIKVAVKRLDEVIDRDRKIDLIKIDAENNEVQVLEGMPDLLGRYQPDIMVECSTAEHFDAAKEMLTKLGYKGFYYISRIGLCDTTNSCLVEPRYPNYLCIANEASLNLLERYVVKLPTPA